MVSMMSLGGGVIFSMIPDQNETAILTVLGSLFAVSAVFMWWSQRRSKMRFVRQAVGEGIEKWEAKAYWDTFEWKEDERPSGA